MSEQRGRTGQKVLELAESVEEDLAEILADLEAVRGKVLTLGDAARAINGLGGDCSGWASHLETIMGEIKKEQAAVPAKLLGRTLAKVEVHVDPSKARPAA